MPDHAALYRQLTEAFNLRDWRNVVEVAAVLGPRTPRHPGLYFMSGVAHMELNRLREALEYLRRATVLEPDNARFAVQRARALCIARLNVEARAEANRAQALGLADPLSFDTLGVVYTQLGAHADAIAAFDRAVELAPDQPGFRYNLATALVASGDIGQAEVQIEACLTLEPHYWRAHLGLAQLRRQTPACNHVERLQYLLSELALEDSSALINLHLALAKEQEDLGFYRQALEHYTRAKSVASKQLDYSAERDEALFKAITESFPDRGATSSGCASREPIFVFGLPRSGTTLVERILSSHSLVQSVGELQNFPRALKQLSNSATPALIDLDTVMRARQIDSAQLGQLYLSSTRPDTGHMPHFVDKLPHNFLYAGWIAAALPEAKIICLRRSPMDSCLSNFRQLFASGSVFFGYSFDLLDTGRYYVLFNQLMAHWQKTFPGRILEVQYESLVESQATISRQILDFCALPWEDACLSFESNPSPITTASAVQARSPIYRDGLARWKRYGSGLDSLQQLLLDAGIEKL